MKLLPMKKCIFGFIALITSIFLYSDNVKAYDISIIDKAKSWANEYHTDLYGVDINNAVVLYNRVDDNYYVPVKRTAYGLENIQNSRWSISYFKEELVLVSPSWWNLYLYKYNKESDSFSIVSDCSWCTGSNNTNYASVTMENENFKFDIVYSDKDVFVRGTQGTNEDFTYNGVEYKVGDIYYYSDMSFDKIYSTSYYSRIEIEIDISDELMVSTGTYIYANLIAQHTGKTDTSSGFPFSKPYIEQTYTLFNCCDDSTGICDNGTYTTTYYNDGDTTKDYYNIKIDGNLNVDVQNCDRKVEKIKFIIPIDSDYGNIRVQFSSNFDYEVTEYENTGFSFTELDLTGKYGAILVAKIHDNDFSANFKVNGYFLLETRDTYNTDSFKTETYATYGFCDVLLEEKENYNCSLSDRFSYIFDKDSPYKVLAITNINYDNDQAALFYYDSSLFDLYEIQEKESTIIIKDPVTGDDYIYNNSSAITNSQNTIDVEYLVKILDEYWAENDNIVSFVKAVFISFFDEMPDYIYKAFVVLLFIMFMCTIIAIMGWK